ncbi:MAG: DEAD/DEAH box helicase [Bacteroidia bacterium]|nr:DEAD/DEAH box helicase [Bacteroidia bacterium]
MKFEEYNIADEIKKSIAELGFRRPTDIQFKAIGPILKGEDVLGIAQTGTGKTAAFAIPIIHLLLQRKKKGTYIKCLVLLPTRELAVQITEVFKNIAKYTNLKIVCLMGGVEQDNQIFDLTVGADIVIATPGRMFDLQSQGYIDLSRVEMLVLDEADKMLDKGFIKDIHDIIKRIPRVHQTLFFSATINRQIKTLAYSVVGANPIRIQISPKNPVSKNVSHAVAFVEMDDKRFFLERLIKEAPESKFLVFVRTKVRAERVFSAMQRVGIETLTMHGGKEQEDRLAVMTDFRNGKVKILIATDLSARGIDIENVDYVINYDLPDLPENYVHRVGRTGRGVKSGKAVSFSSIEEAKLLKDIETFLGYEIPRLEVDKETYVETLDFSDDGNKNWKALMKDASKFEGKKKK